MHYNQNLKVIYDEKELKHEVENERNVIKIKDGYYSEVEFKFDKKNVNIFLQVRYNPNYFYLIYYQNKVIEFRMNVGD